MNGDAIVEVSVPTHWNDLIAGHPQGVNFGMEYIYLDFMVKVIIKRVLENICAKKFFYRECSQHRDKS